MRNPDADTRYDYTHPFWNNANDRVAWDRAINSDKLEERKMGIALVFADPGTPNTLIANKMTAWRIPPRFGYDTEQPGIVDVVELSGDENIGHEGDFYASNYTGQKTTRESTQIPSMPPW